MARKVETDVWRRDDGQFVATWRFEGGTWHGTYAGRCAVSADRDTALRFAVQLALIEDADGHAGRYDIAVDLPTEPTEAGLQFVIPGCEKDRARSSKPQLELF